MPGQILGDFYEVEKQLGKKMGRWTLLARDLRTEAPVILKLLFIDDETTLDELKLFKREVDALQTLTHPATPNYLGYFEIDLPKDGKALALIQTYIEGISLQQILQQKRRLKDSQAKQVATSVLDILCYLHNRQPPIVHRDIKPSNILLAASESNDFKVYLIDFGSVKSFSSASEYTSFTLVGTEEYMPPEQLGRRAVKASDLYSLGATLITAITGVEPVKLPRRGIQIDVEQIMNNQLISIEPSFVQWLKRMTEPELDRRFGSAQDALVELLQLAGLM